MGVIISLGSINADFQVRVDRRPHISETLEARDFRRLSGGKAANVSVLAKHLDQDTLLLGHVGEDDLAEQALAPLRDKHVDLGKVRQLPQESTGVSMITVPPDGKKGIVLANNANARWCEKDIEDCLKAMEQVSQPAVLVMDCEIPVFVLEACAQRARKLDITTVLDPSPAQNVSADLIALADYITPNASEAEQLTGIGSDDLDAVANAGQLLIERGATTACMKLSDGGCVLVQRETCTRVDASPVQVVDTTGAGDAFAGALAVALVEQKSAIDAVVFAVAASHLAVTAYGSQSAIASRQRIDHFSRKLQIHRDELHTH